MHSARHQLGFSLIELLVTLAILGILLGGGVAMFSGFQERREAENVARELQRFMVAMRTKARVQESADCPPGSKLVRFRVEIDTTLGKALGKPICATPSESKFEGNEAGTADTWYEYPFSAPVNVAQGTSQIDFYSVLGGATMINPGTGTVSTDPNFSQRFVISRGNTEYTFSVFGSGEISSVQPVTP